MRAESSDFEDKRPYLLIVDDDEAFLEVLKTVFALEGFEVELAQDGMRAWESLQQRRPDAILCDYLLPYIEGRELLRRLRAHKTLRDVVFVLMTAFSDPGKMVKSMEDGADDYLIKPLNLNELAPRLHTLIAERQKGPSLQGDLTHLSLPDLMQLLSQNRRSGYLEVTQEEERFLFRWDKGEMLDAASFPRQDKELEKGQAPLKSRGEKAAFRALSRDGGGFIFHAGEDSGPAAEFAALPPSEGPLAPVQFLCMEGLRHRDEMMVVLKNFPQERPLFSVLTGVSLDPKDFSETEKQVLSSIQSFGGTASLDSLLDASPALLDHVVVQGLKGLWDRGLLDSAEITGVFDVVRVEPEDEVFSFGEPSYDALSAVPSLPSYSDFFTGLLEGNANQVLAAFGDSLKRGVSPEFLYHKMLGAAMKDVLILDQKTPGGLQLKSAFREALDFVLERLWVSFTGRPPIHGTIIFSWPKATQAQSQNVVTILRAGGFGVFDMGERSSPSLFLEALVNSGSSLLCVVVDSEEEAKRVQVLQRILKRRRLEIPILVSGSFYAAPENAAFAKEQQVAKDSLDALRKAYELLLIPIKRGM